MPHNSYMVPMVNSKQLGGLRAQPVIENIGSLTELDRTELGRIELDRTEMDRTELKRGVGMLLYLWAGWIGIEFCCACGCLWIAMLCKCLGV